MPRVFTDFYLQRVRSSFSLSTPFNQLEKASLLIFKIRISQQEIESPENNYGKRGRAKYYSHSCCLKFPEHLFSVASFSLKWVIPMLSKSLSLEYEELFWLIQKARPYSIRTKGQSLRKQVKISFLFWSTNFFNLMKNDLISSS